MIIIRNKILPFGPYSTMNLFGILFTKKLGTLKPDLINHESIHTELIKELGITAAFIILVIGFIFNLKMWWLLLAPIAFYLWYAIEYLVIRLFHKKLNDAYHDVSLEEEAYNNEDNLDYLNSRSPFNWIKYLKIKSYAGKQRGI